MWKFIAIKVVINAVALWLAATLIGGIELQSGVLNAIGVSIVFGIVNALLKSIATLLTFPLIVLTLGLFTLVINAVMLLLTDWLTNALDVDGFGSAVLGAIVISAVSFVLSMFLPDSESR